MKHTRFPSNYSDSIDTSSYLFDNTESEYLNNAHFLDSNILELQSECYSEENSSFISTADSSQPDYFYISRHKNPVKSRPKSKYFADGNSIRIDDSYSDFHPYSENSYSEISRNDTKMESTGYLIPKTSHKGYFATMPSTSNSTNLKRKYATSPDECYYTDEEATRFMNITEKIYENIEDLDIMSPSLKKICDEGPVLYGRLTILVFNEAYGNSNSRKKLIKAQNFISQLVNIAFHIPLENVSYDIFTRNCSIYGMHITNQLQLTQRTSPETYFRQTKELHRILTQLKNATSSKSFLRKICDKIKNFCF